MVRCNKTMLAYGLMLGGGGCYLIFRSVEGPHAKLFSAGVVTIAAIVGVIICWRMK